jgi:hypothetical protein
VDGWLMRRGLRTDVGRAVRSALAAGATPLRKRDAHHDASRDAPDCGDVSDRARRPATRSRLGDARAAVRKAAQRPRRADLTRRGRSTVLHRLLRSATTLGRHAPDAPNALLLPTRGGVPAAVPFRTQHPLGAVVNRSSVWSDR